MDAGEPPSRFGGGTALVGWVWRRMFHYRGSMFGRLGLNVIHPFARTAGLDTDRDQVVLVRAGSMAVGS